MSDCTNLEMRDLLPDLARGALSGPSRVALEAHLATCATCRAELELVRTAHGVLSAAPSVDTAGIVAAIARSSALRRDATMAVAQTRRRRASAVATPARRAWLAAASVVAIVGAAVLASDRERTPGSFDLPPVVVHIDDPSPAAPVGSAQMPSTTGQPASRVELVMGGGVSDLADADLESLLEVLDDVDTELDVEPAVLLPVLEGDV
jgi:anti-sigma factor RsiW